MKKPCALAWRFSWVLFWGFLCGLLVANAAEAAAPMGQWWDATYSYRQKITVATGATAPVNRYNGYTVLWTINTATLVSGGKMQADCDDLRVLWWNGSAWAPLDREVITCNNASTQVWFKLQADIADSGSDDNYYIYYGNAAVPAGPANKNNVYVFYDDFEATAVGAAPTGWAILVGNASVQNDGAGNKSLRMDSAAVNTRINLRRDITPAEADILVEADCKFDGSATANRNCGPGARWSGTSAADETGYMGDIRYNANATLSQKYITGVWTGIGTLAEAVSLNTVYRVRLTLTGSTVKVYRDGVLKLTNTDTSIATANMLGIDAYNASTGAYEFLDNYLARRYIEPEPTTAAAAEEKQLTGTVYSDEGVTNIGIGKTVRLIINGVDAGAVTTGAAGTYSIAASFNAGDALLVYIDNDATYKGTTVTVASGAGLAGLDIYASHVVTRHDNAGTLTNTLLSTAKGASTDADILYAVAAGNLTVSGAGTVLYVPASHGFVPGGNVTTPAMKSLGTFNGGAGNITINGSLTVAGGAYTATSGTTNIGGGFTVSAGTFNHNNGLITFSGGAKTVNIGSAVLYNVTINMAATMTVSGTMRIDGDLTITLVNFINAGIVAIAGNVTTNDPSAAGSAEFQFIGTGNQTVNAPGASGAIPSVTINKPSGTFTLQGTIEVDGSRGWKYLSGTVDAGTSTVVFDYWSKLISAVGMSFNNVKISITAGTLNMTIDGTMDINGDLTILSVNNIDGGISPGVITVAGNVATSDVSVGGTALLTLDGTGNQTITVTGGDFPDGLFTINKASGTAILASDLLLNGASQNLTVAAGTFDLAGFNLTLPNTLTVASGAFLRLQGGETLSTSSKVFDAGSTVVYNGGGAYASLAAGNSYSNVVFNNASGSWTHTGPLTVKDLTLTAGTLISAGQNVTASGNWSNSGTYTSGTNTVTLSGTTQNITGNSSFYNLTKSVASVATLTLASAATQTVNGLLTLNGASGQLLSLRASTPGNAANLTLAGGGTQAISYVDVKDNNAGGGLTLAAPNSIDSLNNTNWDFGLSSAPLTKQVWDNGGNCLASSNTGGGADSCNSNTASVTVPSGTAVNFLIYIRNTSAVAMSDVRFQDLLDISGSGFTYSAGTMKYSNSQMDAATIANLYTATNGGTAQTDAVGAPDDFASYVVGTLTVGAVAGQANQSVSIPGNRTFAILFQAVKN